MLLKGLRKPFFNTEGVGGGDPGGLDKSGQTKTDGSAGGATIENKGNSEDLTGLKKNRDDLLSENIKLKAERKKIQDAIDLEKTRQMEEDGEYKKLNEKKDKELAAKDELLKNKELKLVGKDLINPEDISLFKDRFEFDENLNVINKDEVMKQIKVERPYLFGEVKPNVPPTANGAPASLEKGHIFTRDELRKMKPDEVEKNMDAINAQLETVGID